MRKILEIIIANKTMSLDITRYEKIKSRLSLLPWSTIVIVTAIILSTYAMMYTISTDTMVAYGDAESHLNITKRVVSGLTPGFAQLGGVWLPLPHLLALPFVYFDFLWRTGLAGAIVSGIAYVVSGYILFKLIYLLTKNTFASVGAFLFFALNPNVLYLQATPMTEIPLVAFFLLSIYFFVKYLRNNNDYIALAFAALFTFCATLTRYDGWFLIFTEGAVLFFQYFLHRASWRKTEARIAFFGVLAIFGVLLWFAWDGLILHDPFYFTNSSFSAKSQQQVWITKGELPTYNNLPLSTLDYIETAVVNSGVVSSAVALLGLVIFLLRREDKNRFFYLLLLITPVIFNIYTLWAGQSVLLVPSITPRDYEWHIFNARYGVVMVPVFAFFIAYALQRFNLLGKVIIILLVITQLGLFYSGRTPVLTYDDAIMGLSAGFNPNSVYYTWFRDNYDGGLILMDDYLRPVSIVKSNIPMQNIIYIGTKPYYEESFRQPQKYARWIFIGKDDDVYKNLYSNPKSKALLDKYFVAKLTTSNFTLYRRRGITDYTQ